MKTAAIFAILALAAPAAAHPAYNYNAAADPCSENRMRACHDDDTCVWTLKPRNNKMGKKEQKNYGHHSGPADKGGSCAARHIYDRVNHMSYNDQKEMLEKHSLNSEWSKVQCEEAFFLKDCKDVSQQGTNTCAWSCEAGCAAAEDGTTSYENCAPPPPEPAKCDGGGKSLIGEGWDFDGEGGSLMQNEAAASGWFTSDVGCCLLEDYVLAQPNGLVSGHPGGVVGTTVDGEGASNNYDMAKICGSDKFDWDADFNGPQGDLKYDENDSPILPVFATVCPIMCATYASA